MSKIILSITTIKSRINNLPKILLSIINKNKSDYTIHIFYSSESNILDDGCDLDDITELEKFIKSNNKTNVQIKLSKTENIGPYKKIIPALKIYKDHIIITVDDDEIFESDIVDLYVDAYKKHKCIISSCGRIIDLLNNEDMNDTICYYKKIFESDIPYMNLLPEGYGGILYHSNMFDEKFINYDYKRLDSELIKNDDIFIRYYTYNKGIPVYLRYIYQSNIYNTEQIKTLFNLNKELKINLLIKKISLIQNPFDKIVLNFDNNLDIEKLILLYNKNNKNDIFKKSVHTGTDVKKLQYKINYADTNKKYTNIHEIIQNKFFPNSKTKINTILINLEKDLFRYETALNEFKKFLISDFIHLKATHWKEKTQFVNDMNNIFEFMINYNSQISNVKLTIDIFSVFNDKNIYIQDGPLACYCSHVRAMIYGFLNFKNYTLIVEDDFHINDIDLIEKNINLIPNDWDIICFGAQPINKFYDGLFYKFTDLFHSTQFYIIKNSSLQIVFENIYPIYDQIDILLSKLHDKINIYNIPNSIMQKNFESNTQNNLYVIYNSPNYKFIRTCIDEIKVLLHDIIIYELKIDEKYHDILKVPLNNIILKILFDVLFSKILHIRDEKLNELKNKYDLNSNDTICENANLYKNYFINNQREKLHTKIYIIMNSCIKGINVELFVKKIVDDIYEIICNFNLANNLINESENDIILPLNYGSTSNVYLIHSINKNNELVIIKEYIHNLRWTYENHTNYTEIIKKEIKILTKLNNNNLFQKIIKYDDNKIYLEYVGETLFDNFNLPINWKEQLRNIFKVLDDNKIIYSEFNLKNITQKDNKIFLIDYGLCLIENEENPINIFDNSINLENFIELLEMLENKFIEINDLEQQHIYYYNFINNIKLDSNSKYLKNIY